MSCMVRLLVLALAGARALATWDHWPLVTIRWTNYRASSEKVCFYFWGHNDTGPVQTKEAVGPVDYKECVTSTTNFSSLRGSAGRLGKETSIPIRYGYVATNASACPADPQLVTVPGTNDTSRLAFLEHAESWMAADWVPMFALYANGFVAQVHNEYQQGLQLQTEFVAPLHCTPENGDIFPLPIVPLDGPFAYSVNFPAFEDRSSMSAPPRIAQELVVGFNCIVLDNPQGDVPGPGWRGHGAKRQNITLNLTEYVRSTCDFNGKAAKLIASIIGDGSAEFPYEYLVRMTPPSLFNCTWPWALASTSAPSPAPGSTTHEISHAADARFVGASALVAVVFWFTLQ